MDLEVAKRRIEMELDGLMHSKVKVLTLKNTI